MAKQRTRGPGQAHRDHTDQSLRIERETVDQRDPDGDLAGDRKTTDEGLTGERSHSDTLIVDQREANEQLVRATLRAQELAIQADEATKRAEEIGQELRKVAEFREMFIGILGHDLRNPLWGISMATGELLRRGLLDERDTKMVVRIVNASQRMGRMITQLLDLTRARLGGGLPLELKPVDLRELCQHIVDELEATIELKVEGEATGTWDPDRLAEALSNLVGNAIEHAAPATAVTVEVHTADAEVVVEVRNQGDPIPAAVLPFIFEPFRRAGQERKSTTGNLGLGLFIAHQIVISHGGTLEARSGGGTTTFVMRLPRHPPSKGETPKA
jgi:signal transduction histidine kinase